MYLNLWRLLTVSYLTVSCSCLKHRAMLKWKCILSLCIKNLCFTKVRISALVNLSKQQVFLNSQILLLILLEKLCFLTIWAICTLDVYFTHFDVHFSLIWLYQTSWAVWGGKPLYIFWWSQHHTISHHFSRWYCRSWSHWFKAGFFFDLAKKTEGWKNSKLEEN